MKNQVRRIWPLQLGEGADRLYLTRRTPCTSLSFHLPKDIACNSYASRMYGLRASSRSVACRSVSGSLQKALREGGGISLL